MTSVLNLADLERVQALIHLVSGQVGRPDGARLARARSPATGEPVEAEVFEFVLAKDCRWFVVNRRDLHYPDAFHAQTDECRDPDQALADMLFLEQEDRVSHV